MDILKIKRIVFCVESIQNLCTLYDIVHKDYGEAMKWPLKMYLFSLADWNQKYVCNPSHEYLKNRAKKSNELGDTDRKQ